MNKNTFVQFDEKNSTVKLTLSFDVTETATTFVPKFKVTFNTFSEIVYEALKQRMAHCKDILTTKILPAKDKVFTSTHIFSNTVGKHFSIVAYNAMEEVKEMFESLYIDPNGTIGDFLGGINMIQCNQILKALANMDHSDIRPELFSECIDAVSERIAMLAHLACK